LLLPPLYITPFFTDITTHYAAIDRDGIREGVDGDSSKMPPAATAVTQRYEIRLGAADYTYIDTALRRRLLRRWSAAIIDIGCRELKRDTDEMRILLFTPLRDRLRDAASHYDYEGYETLLSDIG